MRKETVIFVQASRTGFSDHDEVGALITGADYRGLGVVRSLGRRGVQVCQVVARSFGAVALGVHDIIITRRHGGPGRGYSDHIAAIANGPPCLLARKAKKEQEGDQTMSGVRTRHEKRRRGTRIGVRASGPFSQKKPKKPPVPEK